jgi:pimeloyl-ACP methyl ester carboxylesterase
MNPFRSLTSALTSCVSLKCDRLVAASRRAAIGAIAAMALATATGCGGARALPATAVEAPTVSPAASPVSETMQPWSEGMSDTAPNRFVEKNGIRFAYRDFGRKPGVPVLFLAPFRGTMDSWDPLLTDELARGRPVILFDNAGVGLSNGDAPTTVADTAKDAETFIDALRELHLTDSDWVSGHVDLLGLSLGGFVAQELALNRPDVVDRVVLAGTAPRGGEGFATPPPEIARSEAADPQTPRDVLLVLFARSESSEAAGRAFLARVGSRQKRSRQFGQEQNDACATRGHEGVGRGPDERTLLVSLGHQAASARRRWRGRRRDAHDQLEGSCAAPAWSSIPTRGRAFSSSTPTPSRRTLPHSYDDLERPR